MIVKDFDSREYKWPPVGYTVNIDTVSRSSYHLRARDLLREIFPSERIKEEVPLPGTKLTVDFYIHTFKLAIEVQGSQHYKYSQHFHGSAWNFIRSKANDRMKKEWLTLNGITLIEFPYNESDELWKKRIQDYLQD